MRFALLLVCALAFAAPVVGCAAPNTVTLAAYDRVQEGMTYEEVVAIMGKEGRFRFQSGDEIQYDWMDPSGYGFVGSFVSGKLKNKSHNGLK